MSNDELAQWRSYAEQARSGELYLDDEAAARACLAACNQRIDDLEAMLLTAQRAQRVSGFGDFNMARDLEKAFVAQATGTDNSIDTVIREHIDVVKDMREIMKLSIKRLAGQDVDNSATIDGATQSLE